MGRPYYTELAQLTETYAYALREDVSSLSSAVAALRARPLLIIGSGGSVTACHFAARLHEAHARLPARVITPYEFLQLPVSEAYSVLLLSAGGSNPDILAAANHAVDAEYAPIVAVCTRQDTPLRSVLAPHRHVRTFEFLGPAAKDGFLATNSLILTCALLIRAYGEALPEVLPFASEGNSKEPRRLVDMLCERSHVTALASGWSLPAAMDLESKWAESGLGSVAVTDPRNFAHGRHTGFARRKNESALVAFHLGARDDVLARTLSALPSDISCATVDSELTDAVGGLDLLARVIRLAGEVGAQQGVDLGRPRVPVFGRKLYHARMPRSAPADEQALSDLWILRKVTTSVWSNASDTIRANWREALREWCKTTAEASIGGVVLDYDGTLCEEDERFTAPSIGVGEAISRLIDAGVRVGIATGRGDSVLKALRQVLPLKHWQHVTVGMYNGGLLAPLSADPAPKCDTVDLEIERAGEILASSPLVAGIASVRHRPTQLTVQARVGLPDGLLLRIVAEALASTPPMPRVRVYSSGHTVDVISSGSSKIAVVEAIKQQLSERSLGGMAIMCIGDQGQLTGNDAEFLAHPFGLSVERVSTALNACWNVAPPGLRRSAALLSYLRAIEPSAAGAHWCLRRAAGLGGRGPDASTAEACGRTKKRKRPARLPVTDQAK
jgi:hypothetical protein